jgi:hypothetical protein
MRPWSVQPSVGLRMECEISRESRSDKDVDGAQRARSLKMVVSNTVPRCSELTYTQCEL